MSKYRLSRLAEADLMDIGAYSLNKWGEEQTSAISALSKSAAGSSPIIHNLAVLVIKSGPACVVWNTEDTLSSTALNQKGSGCLASFISAYCQQAYLSGV
jgi:hypothetical protein